MLAFVSYCLLLPGGGGGGGGVVSVHEIVRVQFLARFDRMNKF